MESTTTEHQTLVNNLIQAAIEWSHTSFQNVELAIPRAKALKDAVRQYLAYINQGNSKETALEDTRQRLYRTTQFTRLSSIIALLNSMELSCISNGDGNTLSAVRKLQDSIIKLRSNFE